jgi:hypothetical protein
LIVLTLSISVVTTHIFWSTTKNVKRKFAKIVFFSIYLFPS